jgi:tetratricopeptide (TPR) repeat protein
VRVLPALLALLLLLQGRGAAAAESADRAEGRRHFEAGEVLFRRGEYLAALEQYQEGYRLTRLPGFLINMAHCYRLSGDARKARATYRKYLVVEPASPHKAEVEGLIRSLDRLVSDEDGATRAAEEPRKPKTPSARWWLWAALAASVVGSTVANMALAEAERRQ